MANTQGRGATGHAIDSARILRAGAIGVGGSVVANVALLLILSPLLGLPSSFPPFSVGAIAFFTAFYTIAATALFWLLARFTRRPARTFMIIAAVAFVVTAIPNLASAASPASAPFPGAASDYLTLLAFHLPPFVIIVWALTTLTRTQP